MLQPLHWVSEIGIAGFVDIGLLACLIYGLLVWLRRTRRAGFILGGISILGAVYLLALSSGLVLTTAILQGFFAIFLIVLVVIFQEELRQLFEQVAKWGLNRALAGRTAVQLSPAAVNVRVEGSRRAVRGLRASDIRLSLPMDTISPGFQMLPVSEQMFTLPEGFRITDIRPRQVLGRFEVSPRASTSPQ